MTMTFPPTFAGIAKQARAWMSARPSLFVPYLAFPNLDMHCSFRSRLPIPSFIRLILVLIRALLQ